ncbi:MAG TPA: ABC transporter ATP-binding protein [Anaerolineae bacterium]|nr:ABC transporter ATP-binding protein [Anaerolineae bacterium]HPL30504.1 ABC transporter ATP-binding protein [Anaerolineae bacterium]
MHGSGWRSFLHYDDRQDNPAIDMALLRRVATYGRPYLGRIAAMLGIILAITLLGLVPPLLVRDLIDRTLPQRNLTRLNLLALGMIGIPLVNGLLGVGQRYLGASIGEGVIYDLRVALYAHMQRMSLRFFTNTKTGELMSRLNSDVGGAQRAITGTIVDLITNVITLAGTLAIMVRLDGRLTILAVAVLPLFVIPTRLLGGRLRGVVRGQLSLNAEMNAMMNETLNVSGALLVKLFGRGPSEVGRFAERAGRVRRAGIRQAYLMRWFTLTISLVSAVGSALVFWVGGLLVLRDPAFTIGTIVAFTAYLGALYGPLSALTNARVDFATSMVSFERVFEVLDLPLEIEERPGALTLKEVEGHVTFDHVSFSYQPGEHEPGAAATLSEVVRYGRGASAIQPPLSQEEGRRPVHAAGPEAHDAPAAEAEPAPRWALRDVSFSVRPGQLAAIVGPSGAGKTTITYLLPRLYDPTEGRVTVDGLDIRDLTLDTLAGQIGMVTQETHLFNDTIRANLLYARPDAGHDELEAACRVANIHDFVAGLLEGYDTVVGNRGYRLSGGEKQRLAIARVVLKNPRILVFDEATSSLDSQSEALIQAALERIMVGRTSLVIAHRLSTILAADVILVLDQGRLVEQGTHAELLAQGGLYAQLYETQFRPGIVETISPRRTQRGFS